MYRKIVPDHNEFFGPSARKIRSFCGFLVRIAYLLYFETATLRPARGSQSKVEVLSFDEVFE